MKVTLQYAERQLRHWQKKVNELRLTSNAFDASNTKENEEGREREKRNIPPTPPIKRKGKGKEVEKEKAYILSRAREHAENPSEALTKEDLRILRESAAVNEKDRQLVSDYLRSIPTLERAIKHMALHRNFKDADFIREWYTAQEVNCWCNKFGSQIDNWPGLLYKWIENRAFFNAVKDPERLPDARRRNRDDESEKPNPLDDPRIKAIAMEVLK